MAENYEKTIAVIGQPGVGKATIIGNMIYKCGDINLLTMEHLEKKGIKSYDRVVEELKILGASPSFYTPKHKIFLHNGKPSVADGIILVVKPTLQSEDLSPEPSLDELKECASLFEQNKAIILVNIFQTNEWSETIFKETVSKTVSRLRNIGINIRSTPVIPVSGLSGDNLLEGSSKSPWYSSQENVTQESEHGITLIAALDMILS